MTCGVLVHRRARPGGTPGRYPPISAELLIIGPVSRADVGRIALWRMLGEPEGSASVTTLLIDTDYLIEHLDGRRNGTPFVSGGLVHGVTSRR